MQDPGIFCPICNSVLETQASIGAKNQVLLNRRCKSAINHTFLISLVKLTKEVHQKLKEMSKELNMPMSQCINMLVSKWLKDNK